MMVGVPLVDDRRFTRRAFLFLALDAFPLFRQRWVKIAGIRFRILRHGASPRRYLFIHGNEQTAREVLTEHMKTHAGVAYIVQGNERYQPLEGGRIDPNRMFSRAGAEKNLRTLNPDWPSDRLERALERLDRDRENFLRTILPPGSGRLVALHNNSQGYSVKDEVPISDKVSLSEPGSPHEFFLCTDPADFEKLAKSPYNVVLQNTAPPDDDGSLSRLAAKRRIRYVNLEVALGGGERQREMLGWLEKNLP